MSSEDKFALFEIIKSHQNIIENKKTDDSSSQAKKDAWTNITTIYNGLGKFKRTVEQLKTCYKNSKNSLKKDVAADKAERFTTGGGNPVTQRVDENHPLLSIIQPAVTPLRNMHDSSAEYFHDGVVSMFTSLLLPITLNYFI